MNEFKTKWKWRVVTVQAGYQDDENELEIALNDSWTITKVTPTESSIVYILKKEKSDE